MLIVSGLFEFSFEFFPPKTKKDGKIALAVD